MGEKLRQPDFFSQPEPEWKPSEAVKPFEIKPKEGICGKCREERMLKGSLCQSCGGWEDGKEEKDKKAA